MRYDTIIGIDPGKTGAIAAIDVRSRREPIVEELESNLLDIKDQLVGFIYLRTLVWIENASSKEQVGFMRGVCSMHTHVDLVMVTPQLWMGRMGLMQKVGRTGQRKKPQSVKRALEIWPGIVDSDHNKAEALLIAEAARRDCERRGL